MIYTIVNTKGGTGKTTTALALAFLSKLKTLLIDASQDSNLTAFFQVQPVGDLYTYITKKDKKAIIPVLDTVDLLPASLKTALDGIAITALPPYPVTIIDTQPSLSKLTLSAIKLADIVLIPTVPDLWAVESASVVIKQILGKKRIIVLPTMYERFRKEHREVLKAMPEIIPGAEVLPPVPYVRQASKVSYSGVMPKQLLKKYRDTGVMI